MRTLPGTRDRVRNGDPRITEGDGARSHGHRALGTRAVDPRGCDETAPQVNAGKKRRGVRGGSRNHTKDRGGKRGAKHHAFTYKGDA